MPAGVRGAHPGEVLMQFPGPPLLQALPQESHRPRPGLLRGLEVGPVAIVLGAQEAVAGAFEDVGLVFFISASVGATVAVTRASSPP